MASPIGHGIAGAAAARAAGAGRRATAAAFALALTPDLDLLVGLALEGDAQALHREWWNHSPILGVYGLAGGYFGALIAGRVRRRETTRREALHAGLIGAAVLLTHPLLDFWLTNPLQPADDGLRRALFGLGADAVFYGAIAAAGLGLAALVRRAVAAARAPRG
jgi:hypothetical protein